jgi:hypothetical protein
VTEREALTATFRLAVTWGRIGFAHSPHQSVVRQALPASLWNVAQCLHLDLRDVVTSDLGGHTKVSAAVRLAQQVVDNLEEACRCSPDDDALRKDLETSRGILHDLTQQAMFLGSLDASEDWP